MFKALAVALASSLVLMSCATSPLGRQQLVLVSDSQMNEMGLQAFEAIKEEKPIDTDPHTNAYVRCVANAITDEVGGDWEVVVFEDDTPNAFALPGRKIGVQYGLLEVAQNQDQLATVIGHEVAHVLAKHGNERVSQQLAVQTGLSVASAVSPHTASGQALMAALGVGAQYGILLPYSRVQESEADLYGLDLMAKAGFDPKESVALWVNMTNAGGGQPPEFLSTHPSHDTRIHDLEEHIPEAEKLRDQAHARGKNPQCEQI
ncbi:MAG: M48 family metallopeptidase [Gammaproteobacteria bacterium]|nr:M48 family metallopeptidase [Gammaproteobacteria bacterium]MCI0591736.1 M48 family metallopeptidase [Gammaproteobacteria bacterium]